eukprot:3726325-Rhodomonas_salina.1
MTITTTQLRVTITAKVRVRDEKYKTTHQPLLKMAGGRYRAVRCETASAWRSCGSSGGRSARRSRSKRTAGACATTKCAFPFLHSANTGHAPLCSVLLVPEARGVAFAPDAFRRRRGVLGFEVWAAGGLFRVCGCAKLRDGCAELRDGCAELRDCCFLSLLGPHLSSLLPPLFPLLYFVRSPPVPGVSLSFHPHQPYLSLSLRPHQPSLSLPPPSSTLSLSPSTLIHPLSLSLRPHPPSLSLSPPSSTLSLSPSALIQRHLRCPPPREYGEERREWGRLSLIHISEPTRPRLI